MADRTADDYLDNVTRCLTAAKFEGDMGADLEAMFKKLVRRGEQLSGIDFAMLLVDGKGPVAGVDIKTAVMSELWYKQGDNQSDLAWRAQIASQPSQRHCDVFLVGWPLLRRPDYWTVLADGTEKPARLKYYTSGLSTFIEPVVPPGLWPLTIHKSEAMSVLKTIRMEKAAQWNAMAPSRRHPGTEAPPIPDDWCTTDDLLYNNVDRPHYRPFVNFLTRALSSTQRPRITVSGTKYQPYTSDLYFQVGPHKEFFVEVKFGCAAVCHRPANEDGLVTIKHRTGLSLYGSSAVPVFSSRSGRWAFLLAEISPASERLNVEGGVVPRRMALIPRSLVPNDGGSGKHAKTEVGEVILRIPSTSVIDMRLDVAAQLTSLFCDAYPHECCLPVLEPLRDEANADLAADVSILCGTKFMDVEDDGTTTSVESHATMEMRKKHAVQRQYQGRTSFLVLQECQRLRRGLIFDYQRHLSLRLYAFTYHDWSDADYSFTTSRPRCSPVEMFQLPSDRLFMLLSFTTIQCRAHDARWFVHPSVLATLRQEARTDMAGYRRRIVILSTSESISAPQRSMPAYTVPATCIHYDDLNVDFANHSRWQTFRLKDGYDMDDFRFGSYGDAVKHLVEQITDAVQSGTTKATVCGVEVECVNRDEVFEEILPKFRRSIRDRMGGT